MNTRRIATMASPCFAHCMSPLLQIIALPVDVLVFVLLVCACSLIRLVFAPRTPTVSLPPGPRTLPFIGNILSIPNSRPWITFRDLSRHYGMFQHIHTSDAPGLIVHNRQYDVPQNFQPICFGAQYCNINFRPSREALGGHL